MTDVSDGLVADLGAIAEASGVRIDLSSAELQPAAKLRDVSSALNADPMSWVLGGGDDYGLVATFGNGVRLPEPWQVIGRVSEGSRGADGRPAGARDRPRALSLEHDSGRHERRDRPPTCAKAGPDRDRPSAEREIRSASRG